ncbi:amidohydrolase family protein [Streptomyces ipomoeae]|uniref:amidohydrolase family protein n=1 Tax=Streptomyces ipomoeae TaxID=103232 RepID=UPI001FD1F569|nr:amidohydrolase family protein [Streptomyces ipomoeae]MDX2935212.1 amidohydrolase family protein [Streptomyces ipomoeae]
MKVQRPPSALPQQAYAVRTQAQRQQGKCRPVYRSATAEYLRRIEAYADQHPDAEWITGGGWSLEAFPGGSPTAAALDAIVPDRPVFLPNRDHHGARVNSRALQRAGIDSRTPDPADGRIERHADGNPMDAPGGCRPPRGPTGAEPPTPEEQLAALLRARAVPHSYGVTARQDAVIGTYTDMTDPAPAYRAAPDAPEGTPAFLPEQRLDPGAAIAAYTAGSAYVNHLDGSTGSITVGKSADPVVLDRDPFAGPPEEIAATRVMETFVEGQRVTRLPTPEPRSTRQARDPRGRRRGRPASPAGPAGRRRGGSSIRTCRDRWRAGPRDARRGRRPRGG